MIEPGNKMSVRRQCRLLDVARSGIYREEPDVEEEDKSLMKQLDKLHLEFPFYGSRKFRLELKDSGININRKRVQRLMQMMGIAAMVPKPSTSEPRREEHQKFPYLLRHLAIVRPNQVWCADITYIPTKQGFAFLVAIMDWYSRRVLAWRLSNTLDTSFCVEALQEALNMFGVPGIFNTDQGCQFTDSDFTKPLLDRGVKVSMDGKGRFMDNIFIERLWRTLKYEEVYLNEYDDLVQARNGIGRYIKMYNQRRRHQALGYQTPPAFYEFEIQKRQSRLAAAA